MSKRKQKNRNLLSNLKDFWLRFRKNKSAVIGLAILIIFIIVSIFGNLIVPYERVTTQNAKIRLQEPSINHYFGTDGFGRDVFARIIHATPISLFIGISVSFLCLFIGGSLGISSGYFGGRYDEILMRIVDIVSSIPAILLAMVVLAVLGPSMGNLIIAMTLSRIRATTRLSRSAVFSTLGQEYIEAAKAGGSTDLRIMLKHIVPNIVGILTVDTTMNIAHVILAASSLSFLGLGVQPPTPEWGSMLSEARVYMRGSAHLMIFPGMAIVLAALSINLVGDGLRDSLDPRLKS